MMQNGIVANPMENPIKDPITRASGIHFKYSETMLYIEFDLEPKPHLGSER